MNRSLLLMLVGILLALVSLLADMLGLGKAGFGPKQISGTVAGVVLLVVGLALRSRGKSAGPAQ